MKLRNIRSLGRFKNVETGKEYNVKSGRRVGRSTDHLFYFYRFKRVFISDADFYSEKYIKVTL